MSWKKEGWKIYSIALTYVLAFIGGISFYLWNIPIPWILGPLTVLVIVHLFSLVPTSTIPGSRDLAFTLLGIQIGLSFAPGTFSSIAPYLLPYTFLSSLMIAISLLAGFFISRMTSIDRTTALVGSSPGGLSAMIAVSESLKGNSALVTIFHTLRLISVLFIIPFIVTHWVSGDSLSIVAGVTSNNGGGSFWTVLLYPISFVLGWKTREWIPASLVVIPMLFIGILQASGIAFYPLPDMIYIGAQLLIGAYLGHTILLREIVVAGKACLYFLSLALFIIGIGLFFSFALVWWTNMDLTTAVLSLAPGGLVEMAITAEQTGAEPAVVSSLQTIRLLMIVLLLPMLFKKYQKS